jgi:hypothetical protein
MTAAAIQKADSFLVTYGAGEQSDYERCDTLAEAKAAYQEPPMGWVSLGISACQNRVPFAMLDLELTFGRKPIQIVRPHSKVLA